VRAPGAQPPRRLLQALTFTIPEHEFLRRHAHKAVDLLGLVRDFGLGPFPHMRLMDHVRQLPSCGSPEDASANCRLLITDSDGGFFFLRRHSSPRFLLLPHALGSGFGCCFRRSLLMPADLILHAALALSSEPVLHLGMVDIIPCRLLLRQDCMQLRLRLHALPLFRNREVVGLRRRGDMSAAARSISTVIVKFPPRPFHRA
jgi:hypothetical protein